MPAYPALFVSHGAPTFAVEPGPARDFLRARGEDLAARHGKPRAIVVASAHWETPEPTLLSSERPPTIHDFRGFPEALYRLRYPAPGAREVAAEAAALLAAAGFAVGEDERRGFDHGAWVPLSLLFPEADVPVTQLSLQTARGPAHHARLGEALRALREDGVLVLGSGQVTHNLAEVRFGAGPDDRPPAHVVEFVEWLAAHAAADDREALLDYRRRAPHAARNHPTDEHLLPFFVALGASEPGRGLRRVHESVTFGTLRMDVYESV